MTSDPQTEDALARLRSADAARAMMITSKRSRFAEIAAEAKVKRDAVKAEHRQANRALITAIREAQALGIPFAECARILHKTVQTVYRIQAEVAAWDLQKQNEALMRVAIKTAEDAQAAYERMPRPR